MSLNIKAGLITGLAVFGVMVLPVASFAQEEYRIVIKDHHFNPKELSIPSGKKVKVFIDNQDATPEEFESYELNREKVIPANSKGIIFLGPLGPGRYKFFGDFHQDTAQGVVVAGAAQ